MKPETQQRIQQWLDGNYDEATKNDIKNLQQNDANALEDAFYQNLEFGTGGLRGLMGVGTNRMNKYTVGMATQGYANYLKQSFPNEDVRVAIAHDSRNNSRFFAETAAHVFAANGIKVFLFDDLRPTPELSYAIRNLHCQGGVVCTASHNPKEYNGYKAYWNDGGQLVPPHDKNVIAEVNKIQSVDDVQWSGHPENISIIGENMDEQYISMVTGLSVYPDIIGRQKDLKIVYTPIHGTGIMLVPRVLKKLGFDNVHIVAAQQMPDGNFPTVNYPNPEEKETMSLGLQEAKELDADILLGTDPDADRVGIGVKDDEGNWILMNGNQTAILAFNYMLEARKAKGINRPEDMIITTIVTTGMADDVARGNDVKCYRVLTGFKWIAELIREKQGQEQYIIGGEESFGLMIGDQVRDKDAVSACAILCEMAAYEKEQGKTLFQKLVELYIKYGFYKEHLISITKKGMDGQQQIADMMQGYRDNPPKEINGVKVVKIADYDQQQTTDTATGGKTPISLPKSNVLQFMLEDGTLISARPSGTEPKIKFYFSVKEPLSNAADYHKVNTQLDDKIQQIISSMGLN